MYEFIYICTFAQEKNGKINPTCMYEKPHVGIFLEIAILVIALPKLIYNHSKVCTSTYSHHSQIPVFMQNDFFPGVVQIFT